MKLKSVRLCYFQNHKDTTIRFHSGVNAIVGSSDVGKSAILRALRWVFHNEPSGDDFCSHWAGDYPTRVIVKLSSGVKIERHKGKGINKYVLRQDGKAHVFKSFKTSVPEPIASLFPLSDLNWQNQLDEVFALSSSPAELGRALNEVANLDEIDLALSNVNGFVRKAEQDKSQAVQTLTNVRQRLTQFKPLKGIEARMEVLSSHKTELEQMRICKDELEGKIEDYRKVLKKTKKLSNWKAIALRIHRATVFANEEIGQRKATIALLLKFMQQTMYLSHAQKRAKTVLQEWKSEMPETCPLCGRGD